MSMMADKLHVFRRSLSMWRVSSNLRALARRSSALPAGSCDAKTPSTPKNRRALCSVSAKRDYSMEPEAVTNDIAASTGSDELTDSESKKELERDDDLLMPFKSGVDASTYPKDSFQYLFENSRFVKALDPVGKEVEAEVLAVVGDKLYVDFGCKFHAVVTCPNTAKESVQRGTRLVILVKDLEVTQAFIGGSKHDSLLEATADFVRLLV